MTLTEIYRAAGLTDLDLATDVEPHEFHRLRRWRNRGRCIHCLIHEAHHPTSGWAPARALKDEREALRIGAPR